MAQLLLTGGAGFIGSHTCLVLLQAGHHLVVLDDFSNSSPIALERVGEQAEAEAAARLTLLQGDIRNRSQLEQAFARASSPVDAVSISQDSMLWGNPCSSLCVIGTRT